MVRPQSRGVKDDIEVGGGDSTLPDRLAHQEKIIPAVAEIIPVVNDVWRNGASCRVAINVVGHPEAMRINCR